MKLLISFLVLAPVFAFAQAASPVPAPAPVVSGGISFLSPQILALLGASVVFLNSVFSALQVWFNQLSKQEPGVLADIGKVLATVSQWISGNPQLK
jgi:hypothetical protein